MNLLLDEQLDTKEGSICTALNAFTRRTSLTVHSIPADKRGMEDDEVVTYCRERGFDALISFNHRDFGSKKALYRDLVAAGISIVVLRPPKKPAFTPERQLSLISQHTECIRRNLEHAQENGPVLLRLSPSECRPRSLEELEAEFEDATRALP